MKRTIITTALLLASLPANACDSFVYVCQPLIEVWAVGSDGSKECNKREGYYINDKKMPSSLFRSDSKNKLTYRGQKCLGPYSSED